MARKIFLLLPILFFIACTQLTDDNSYIKSYTGDDGCLICHTNEARLQALAPSESGGGPPDGG